MVNPADFPLVMSEVWGWFQEADSARQRDPLSGKPLPISEQEFAAFFANRNIRPFAWQMRLLRKLDILSRNHKALQTTRD